MRESKQSYFAIPHSINFLNEIKVHKQENKTQK